LSKDKADTENDDNGGDVLIKIVLVVSFDCLLINPPAGWRKRRQTPMFSGANPGF